MTDAARTDADLVRDAVLDCPDVAALAGGQVGQVASYLPGCRVIGVRTSDTDVEVHVVVRPGRPFADIGDDLSARLSDVLGGRRLEVVVDDVVVPGSDATG